MRHRLKWTERTFDFSYPVGLYPEMIERLRGTVPRLEDHFKNLSSETLTTRHDDRFGPNDWSPGEFGAPVLRESLAVFECRSHAVHDGGDHHILVGEVVKASFDGELDPLLFFRGKYRRLHFD